MIEVGVDAGSRNFRGKTEPGNQGRRQRAGSNPPLLPAAEQERLDATARAIGDIQRADAFRAVEFVAGQRQQVNRQFPEINPHLAHRLRRVDVEQDVTLAANCAERLDVLDDAGLIIDVHDRRELRILSQRRGKGGGIQDPVLGGAQPGDLVALLLEHPKHVGHRFVLGRHRHQVLAAMRSVSCSPGNGEVVRLGRSRGPDQRFRVDVQQCRQLACRMLDAGPAFSSGNVVRRGICEARLMTVEQQFGHPWIDRRRRRIVEVDRIVLHSPERRV